MIVTNKADNKIKVGMLISTYFPVWGGAQKQIFQLSKYLLEKDVQLFVLTRALPGTKKYEKIGGIDIYRVFVTNRFKFLDSLLYTFFSLFWLLRNRHRFNILHCYQIYSPATIGVLAKRLLGSKNVVVKVTASNEYGEVQEVKRLPFTNFRIKLLKKVDRFIVVNRQMEKELSLLGIPCSRVNYIPNGVDIPDESSFQPQVKMKFRKLLGLNFEKIVIFTGRLSQEKCLDTLLLAWEKISSLHPEAHLIVLGNGGSMRNVEKEIIQLRSSLKLDTSVHMLGKVDNVLDYLLASDIFVLPSISEGLSNSLLEAMAAGLGIVAGDNDGNRQVVRDGENGLLVQPKDVEKLFSALLNLIENTDYTYQLGKKAKETVARDFSLKNIAQEHIDLYRKCLSGNEVLIS